ncbi:glycosyltransferase family A protein [Mycoplasma hafezii]|uniref:glycosyltransferase family A protein n=1 Tax=Mycoplasma hafezii TaxID=525886 RepID=UPI003CF87063
MKLSLISLVGNSAKEVDWYLKDLKDQQNQDFEVILCINKNTELKGILDVIEEHKDFFGKRLVVLFNTKQNSYHHNLKSAFELVKGDYVAVVNSNNNLKKYYTERMIQAAEEKDVDILEFKPRIVGSVRFKPAARLEPECLYPLPQCSNVFAYTFPFIFNKIYKKSIVKKAAKYNIEFTNDSKLCSYFVYLLMLEAKSYMYVDYRIYREYFGSDMWLNSKNFLISMNSVEQIFNSKGLKLNQELRYAKYYLLKLLITAFLTETSYLYKTFNFLDREFNEKRSERSIQKHSDLVAKMQDSSEFINFNTSNIYMLKGTAEAKLLGRDIKELSKVKILDTLQ